MLKRLYVHNYKCLVNFEINFDKDISLFLGANGSGKSTVFEVLRKVISFIVNEEKTGAVFYETDFPRWLNIWRSLDENVVIEIDIEEQNNIFRYRLELSPHGLLIDDQINVKNEFLYLNNEIVFELNEEKNDKLLVSRSGIARCFPALEFQQILRKLFIARINPYEMGSNIFKSNAEIKTDFSNYAEWFSHLNEKNRKGVSIFEKTMRDILPGFDYFRIEQAGQAKVLQVDFENKSNKRGVITYDFNELSEGQKVLIALYALVYCAPENSLICIDEPENFLALPEIQPWFDTLYDQCTERGLQALLISHHPKIINLLANDSGYWFSRENNLTRIQKISPENESGLSIAELVDRGWIYEQ